MAVLIAPFGFACLTFLIYLALKARHAERMSIIERGLDVKDLNLGASSKWVVLRLGMLLIAISMGFFFGFMVEANFPDFPAVPQITLVLLLGGLALIANFFVENKWRK